MSIVDEIKKNLTSVCKDLGIEAEDIHLDLPAEDKFGDYSTNVALKLSKKLGQNPLELAQKIAKAVNEKKLSFLEKVEAAEPGFINFFLSDQYLSTQLGSLINDKEKVAKTGQTVLIEYTDPNPFKEFHIGHLYSNIVGESLARISEWQGNDVKRLCYQGDVGLHVAKAVFGMQLKLKEAGKTIQDLGKEPLRARVKFMGQSYALGDKAYNEDSEAKSEIIELNKKLYTNDSVLEELYSKGREWSLKYFDTIYQRIGTKFDKFYFESEVGPKGITLVKKHIKGGYLPAGRQVFEKSEGAIIFDGEKYGLHKRVFINSMGLPTYEAKELALAEEKYKDFAFDLSIIVTAKEVSEYFKVLFKAISLITPDLSDKMKHIGHGFVKLPEGKMSSRTGNVISGEWLLDKAVSEVKAKYPEMDDKTAEQVGVGAVKYSLLKSGMGKDVIFNFDESISLEGNSGPYLQYTYVRCISVLKKAEKTFQNSSFSENEISKEDRSLLKKLSKFESQFIFTPEFSQSTLCTYLYELASVFNLFYSSCPILKSENEDFRLGLVRATANVLGQGLYLLGIAVPTHM